jgi:hypothetical protein
MANTHNGYHKAVKVMIGGEEVEVDEEILDLVSWINAIEGAVTTTSCQGGAACCSTEAFVHFTTDNPRIVETISEFVRPFGTVRPAIRNMHRIEFPDTETLRKLNQAKFPIHFGPFKKGGTVVKKNDETCEMEIEKVFERNGKKMASCRPFKNQGYDFPPEDYEINDLKVKV